MIENHSILSSVPLLEGLSPDDLNALAPNIESRVYQKGETLFLKGDKGGALLIVVDGGVDLFVYDDDEKRVLLSHVSAGGFFGEVTMFDNSARTTNAIATVRTTIFVVRADVMTNFLR